VQAKIVSILDHDNPIFCDGARKDDTTGLAQPTDGRAATPTPAHHEASSP
jgi:hypothetical protein